MDPPARALRPVQPPLVELLPSASMSADDIQHRIRERDSDHESKLASKALAALTFDSVRSAHRRKAGVQAPGGDSPGQSSAAALQPPLPADEGAAAGSPAQPLRLNKEQQRKLFQKLKKRIKVLESELALAHEMWRQDAEAREQQLQTMHEILDARQLRLKAHETLATLAPPASASRPQPNEAGTTASAADVPTAREQTLMATVATLSSHMERQASEIVRLREALAARDGTACVSTATQTEALASASIPSLGAEGDPSAMPLAEATAARTGFSSAEREKLLQLLAVATDAMADTLARIGAAPAGSARSRQLTGDAERVEYVTSHLAALVDTIASLGQQCQHLHGERDRLQRDFEAAVQVSESMQARIAMGRAAARELEFRVGALEDEAAQKQRVVDAIAQWLQQHDDPADIAEHFESFGKINDVYLPKSYHTGRPRGFAYVKFDNQDDADMAIAKLQTIVVRGETLTVEWATGERKSAHEMRREDPRGRDSGRDRDRDSGRDRDRDYGRDRDRDYGRDRDRDYGRDRDRDHGRDRDYGRDRDRDYGRDRDRDYGRDRDRDYGRSRDRDDDRGDSRRRSRSRERRRSPSGSRSPRRDRRSRSRSNSR
ncbi:Arginine/serine-rich splicing factor scl25a transcript I [Polyrhizophydium stewartii]|uniref:Arginine/serine-rich splicing factor scl25a transcript I n=1 Tax=Polyrhizophydium stewartii TaxID=2732419 RepID=A0ABR4NBN9_9FUNG